MELKVTWEREASRVIWDLQVHKEKLVREESWAKKVKQAQKARREVQATQATRVRKDRKEKLVHKVLLVHPLHLPPLHLPPLLLPPLYLPPLLPRHLHLNNVEVQDGGELSSST